MDKTEVLNRIETLTKKKSQLETQVAVKESELSNLKSKLEESSAKVIEIVGSDNIESVKEYLSTLENDIEIDINKLNSLGE